jgi:hypothetical protein
MVLVSIIVYYYFCNNAMNERRQCSMQNGKERILKHLYSKPAYNFLRFFYVLSTFFSCLTAKQRLRKTSTLEPVVLLSK